MTRSGEPTWSSVSSSPDRPPWAADVQWTKANVLNPDEYLQHLQGADAVVHSMGILLEADYKGVLQGKESPFSGLSRAFSATKAGSQNPLARRPGEELRPQEKDGQLTYELMNRDSAILLAKEASANSVPTFVYISAAAGAPVLPKRYITTKREAESTIASSFPSMRSVFIRAPFMWDASRSFTVPLAAATGVASLVNSAVGGRLTWLMGAGGTKPLKADLVGDAVVEAVEGGEAKGPVEVPEIEALATKAWRRNML
ncbi:putative nad dependent epimerase dehydratase family protein [Neofusicoccum parvum UCRNP2]|uniref:Putative nad dependent epimerase dehydratase family protein n=1 Tax=Botryosphaeria parva (strain UCR-NP2) TaxID=1287680 RepID=R1GCT9_BOTPV|nr:putative nad dependent epimerase dehydratase family protein [Neofusicoccum parvum UCRNP2]